VGLKKKATILSKQQGKRGESLRLTYVRVNFPGARPESDDGYNNNKVRISSEKKRLVTEVEFEREGMWDSSVDTVEFVRSNS
jgi:hypothetical protein